MIKDHDITFSELRSIKKTDDGIFVNGEFIPENHLEKSFKKLGFKITIGLWISCMLILLAIALPLLITGIKDFNKLKENENQINQSKKK